MAKRKFEHAFMKNVDEKMLECTICCERLQNHRSLNCLHSFCLACLEIWVGTNSKLTCPTCSKLYAIPEGGLGNLQPNILLTNLLETVTKFSNRDQMKCFCGKEELAKNYCQDCRHYLCSSCSIHHKILPVLANHKLHLVDDLKSMNLKEIASLHPPLCPSHKKAFEFYCVDCKQPICLDCIIKGHKECEQKPQPISISEAFQAFKETSAELQDSVKSCRMKLQDGLTSVIQNSTKLEQSKEDSLRDIGNHVQEMVETINENGNMMKENVETIYNMKKKVADIQIDELTTIIFDIDTNETVLNQLLDSDEATAIQSSDKIISSLKDKINKFAKTEPNDNGQICFVKNKQNIDLLKQCRIGNVTQLKFTAAECLKLCGGESVTMDQMIIGNVIRTQIECQLDKNNLKATWTYPTGETDTAEIEDGDNGNYIVSGKCKIPGVCRLDVWANDQPIEKSPMIIDVEEVGLVNTVQIKRILVRDIVKCQDDCLLVSCRTNAMYKFRQSGEYVDMITLPQGVQVNRMYKMKDGNIAFSYFGTCIKICSMHGEIICSIGEGVLKAPYGVHVDEASDTVYVADSDSGCVYTFNINNGQMIQRIGSLGNEPGQMRILRDVTLTKQGHILVLDHRLQVFDNEGRFIKVLVRGGYENGEVNIPRGVVVDEDDNIIISSNHKLQLFSSDGKFIKRIDKEEDGINDPFGLCIISHYPRRIAVTNNRDITVKIFNY